MKLAKNMTDRQKLAIILIVVAALIALTAIVIVTEDVAAQQRPQRQTAQPARNVRSQTTNQNDGATFYMHRDGVLRREAPTTATTGQTAQDGGSTAATGENNDNSTARRSNTASRSGR